MYVGGMGCGWGVELLGGGGRGLERGRRGWS